MSWLLVGLAGAVGAVARYLVDLAITARRTGVTPWGTSTVNVSGSFLAGLVAGLVVRHGLAPELHTIVGGGFLGAYTTFSTAMYETARLLEERAPAAAVVTLVLPLVAAVVAAFAGWLIAT